MQGLPRRECMLAMLRSIRNKHTFLPIGQNTALRKAIEEQLLYRNVQRFRGGLLSKAHRLVYHPTLGVKVIMKKKAVKGSGRNLDGRGAHEKFTSMCEGIPRL